MDFRTPDFIIDALKRRLQHPVFGYTAVTDEYYRSIISWVQTLHGWELKREWLSYIPGIVRGIALSILCFSHEGDKVIIQPPVYHPFRIVPQQLRRVVVNNPLRLVNGSYEMDFEQLEAVIDNKCKLFILSNPHNPAGIAWSSETLQRLAEICARHGVIVVSDEIHSEMVYPGFRHCPFPTVSTAARECSITFAAPSKTFNIAGIVASYSVIPDKVLRERFYSFLEAGEFESGSLFSYIATIAAYTHGAEWRRQMLDYVIGNVSFVDEYLRANIPDIKVFKPQASFLVWLDCRELKQPSCPQPTCPPSGVISFNQKQLVRIFIEGAGLALNDGEMFGMEGNGFMRMNIGCSRDILADAMERLKLAVNGD
jgi:cystathionine beta-lyase